jgi:hypothetical protein
MREDPVLAEAYKKNQEEELFLENFNNILAPYEKESYKKMEEKFPTLHIIGAPRSGTTILMQLICSHLDVGYINNLIAAFWKTPTIGIRLSKKLLPTRVPSSYNSDFGRTKDITEPHEFGYFWSSLLGYPEMSYQGDDFENCTDWDHVKMVLTNMIATYNCPIVFKSLWMAWHLKKMQEVLPKTCFIFIRRNPVDNALSLLYYRKKFLGSIERWVSMKPSEYEMLKEKPYWEQIAGQVYFIEKLILNGIKQIGNRNVVELSYEDICKNPRAELSKVLQLLNENGGNVNFISKPPDSFQSYVEKTESKEEQILIKNAVMKIYGTDKQKIE